MNAHSGLVFSKSCPYNTAMSTTQDYLLRLIELRKVATAVPQDPGSQAMAAAAKINPMSGNATITPIDTSEKQQGPAQADLDKKDKEIQKLQSEAESAKLELQKEKAKAELIKTHQQNLERSKAEREKLQKEKEKLKSDLEISKARMQQAESEHTTRMQNISAQQKVQMAEDRAKSMMSAADQNAKAYVKMTQDAAKDSNAFFADSQKALNAQHSALLKDKDALLKDKEKFVNDKLNRSSGLSPLLTRRLQNAAAATRNLAKLRSHLQGMSGVYMSKASAAPAPAQQQPAQQQPAPQPASAPTPQPASAPAPQPASAPAPQQQQAKPAPGTTQLVNQQDRYNALRSKYTLGQNASLSDLARTQAALKREVEEGRLARQDVRGAQRYLDEVTSRMNATRRQVNTAARKGDVDAVNQQRDYSALTYRPKGWFTTGRSALDDMSAVRYDPRVESRDAAQRATEGRGGKWWRAAKVMLEGLNPFSMIERTARNADMSRHIANTYDVDQNLLTGYSGANANRASALADELKLKQSWGGNIYDQAVSLANAASYAIPGTGLAHGAALGGGLLAANMATANGGRDDGSIMTVPTQAAQDNMTSKIASVNTPPAQPVTPKGMTSFTPVRPEAASTKPAEAPAQQPNRQNGTTMYDAPESSSAEGRRNVGEGGKHVAQELNLGFPADTFYKSRVYMSSKEPATQLIRGVANAFGMPILNGGTGNGTYAGNLGITSRLAAAMMRANDPYMLESTGIHGGPLAYGTTKDVSGHNAFLAQQWAQGGSTPVANTAWSDRSMA